MLKKKLIRISSSIIKILLPLISKILMKFKINRRVINYLHERSYFGNQQYDFSEIIRTLLKSEKLIALDVGAQGGFNSDIFFPKKYNDFFEPILVEPIKSEAEKLNENKFVIQNALWSSKIKKKINILDNRLGSSSMFEPDIDKFEMHDIKDNELNNFKVTRTVEVDCDTIDNSLKKLNFENLDYLKIDTQGSELEILKGIGHYRPQLIKIEAHIYSMYKEVPEWNKLVNFLYELNYLIIDWKGIGKHKARLPAEMEMIFIPNFNSEEGKKKIMDNQAKFISLLLIFGQINILKLIVKKLKINFNSINKFEDLYFN